MNDGGGSGASCGGTEVRTDTTMLSNAVIVGFGDGRNLVGQGKMFTKDEAKVTSRVGGIKCGVVYLVKLFFESNECQSWRN